MKPRSRRLAILPTLLLLLPPLQAWASVTPSSLSFRWGYIPGGSTREDYYASSPSLSATWDLGRRTALWSSLGYIQEQPGGGIAVPTVALPLGTAGAVYPAPSRIPEARTHLIPLTMGLRVYAHGDAMRSRGPFLEAGPAGYLANYRERDGKSHSTVLGGVQAGLGVRFAGIDGSRAEIGMNYHLAEAFGMHPDAIGRVGTPQEIDYSLFSAYVAFGFGD